MKAIILAAGMGTRLRPLTNDTPKALVKVNGVPMIERQIEFLLAKGIKEIFVVTGYLHEKFDYLTVKYGVELIHNDKYAQYNNIYTMYLVKELLPDSYILEGDVFLNHNVIEPNVESSLYFTSCKPEFQNEWVLVTDENDRVTAIDICEGGSNEYIMCGISYWSRKDGELIARKLADIVETGNFSELYWDDVVRGNISQVNVHVRRMDANDTFEIDSVEDLRKVEKQSTAG